MSVKGFAGWLAAVGLISLIAGGWLAVVGELNAGAVRAFNVLGLNPEPVIQRQINYQQPRPQVTVPILMYHYIRAYQSETDNLGVQLSVAPETFDRQLTALKRAGYRTISLTDFALGNYGVKPIILTFDDGYLSHYSEALPILQKHRFLGTFFIASGLLSKNGYLNREQVEEMAAAGMEIGGHTVTHRNLEKAPYEQAITEIYQSLIGRDQVFAYPSGRYGPETLDILSGLRIKAAVTTNFGLATEKSELLELPRIRVKEKTDILKVIEQEKKRLLREGSQASQY